MQGVYIPISGRSSIKSGFLLKEGAKHKSWKSRFFALDLDRRTLSYHKNKTSPAINFFSVDVIQSVRILEKVEKKKIPSKAAGCLLVSMPDRDLFVCATSKDVLEDWRSAIEKVISKANDKREKDDNPRITDHRSSTSSTQSNQSNPSSIRGGIRRETAAVWQGMKSKSNSGEVGSVMHDYCALELGGFVFPLATSFLPCDAYGLQNMDPELCEIEPDFDDGRVGFLDGSDIPSRFLPHSSCSKDSTFSLVPPISFFNPAPPQVLSFSDEIWAKLFGLTSKSSASSLLNAKTEPATKLSSRTLAPTLSSSNLLKNASPVSKRILRHSMSSPQLRAKSPLGISIPPHPSKTDKATTTSQTALADIEEDNSEASPPPRLETATTTSPPPRDLHIHSEQDNVSLLLFEEDEEDQECEEGMKSSQSPTSTSTSTLTTHTITSAPSTPRDNLRLGYAAIESLIAFEKLMVAASIPVIVEEEEEEGLEEEEEDLKEEFSLSEFLANEVDNPSESGEPDPEPESSLLAASFLTRHSSPLSSSTPLHSSSTPTTGSSPDLMLHHSLLLQTFPQASLQPIVFLQEFYAGRSLLASNEITSSDKVAQREARRGEEGEEESESVDLPSHNTNNTTTTTASSSMLIKMREEYMEIQRRKSVRINPTALTSLSNKIGGVGGGDSVPSPLSHQHHHSSPLSGGGMSMLVESSPSVDDEKSRASTPPSSSRESDVMMTQPLPYPPLPKSVTSTWISPLDGRKSCHFISSSSKNNSDEKGPEHRGRLSISVFSSIGGESAVDDDDDDDDEDSDDSDNEDNDGHSPAPSPSPSPSPSSLPQDANRNLRSFNSSSHSGPEASFTLACERLLSWRISPFHTHTSRSLPVTSAPFRTSTHSALSWFTWACMGEDSRGWCVVCSGHCRARRGAKGVIVVGYVPRSRHSRTERAEMMRVVDKLLQGMKDADDDYNDDANECTPPPMTPPPILPSPRSLLLSSPEARSFYQSLANSLALSDDAWNILEQHWGIYPSIHSEVMELVSLLSGLCSSDGLPFCGEMNELSAKSDWCTTTDPMDLVDTIVKNEPDICRLAAEKHIPANERRMIYPWSRRVALYIARCVALGGDSFSLSTSSSSSSHPGSSDECSINPHSNGIVDLLNAYRHKFASPSTREKIRMVITWMLHIIPLRKPGSSCKYSNMPLSSMLKDSLALAGFLYTPLVLNCIIETHWLADYVRSVSHQSNPLTSRLNALLLGDRGIKPPHLTFSSLHESFSPFSPPPLIYMRFCTCVLLSRPLVRDSAIILIRHMCESFGSSRRDRILCAKKHVWTSIISVLFPSNDNDDAANYVEPKCLESTLRVLRELLCDVLKDDDEEEFTIAISVFRGTAFIKRAISMIFYPGWIPLSLMGLLFDVLHCLANLLHRFCGVFGEAGGVGGIRGMIEDLLSPSMFEMLDSLMNMRVLYADDKTDLPSLEDVRNMGIHASRLFSQLVLLCVPVDNSDNYNNCDDGLVSESLRKSLLERLSFSQGCKCFARFVGNSILTMRDCRENCDDEGWRVSESVFSFAVLQLERLEVGVPNSEFVEPEWSEEEKCTAISMQIFRNLVDVISRSIIWLFGLCSPSSPSTSPSPPPPSSSGLLRILRSSLMQYGDELIVFCEWILSNEREISEKQSVGAISRGLVKGIALTLASLTVSLEDDEESSDNDEVEMSELQKVGRSVVSLLPSSLVNDDDGDDCLSDDNDTMMMKLFAEA